MSQEFLRDDILKENALQEIHQEEDMDRPVLTSLVISGKEINISPRLPFSPVAQWNPLSIFKSELDEDEIDILSAKDWLCSNYLPTLTNQGDVERIMKYNKHEVISLVRSLKPHQLLSVAAYCYKRQDPKIIQFYWESELLKVGFSLLDSLGMIKFGHSIQESQLRLWVGRTTESNSKTIEFRTKRADFTTMGGNFITSFLGPRAKIGTWSMQHRGGLWRIFFKDSDGEKSQYYIEEFDNANFL